MENADEKIVLKRGKETEYVQMTAPQQYLAQPMMAAPQVAPPAVATAEAAAPAPAKGDSITSPIVGTFYRAPSPESPAYVEVGSVVEKGQVLCIVEAMKLMNEIEAEFRCKIIEICKENAKPVEFGDPLFIVERL
jgi:acetyl-CoA carboxylase biotin carboxyl carrier protein